MRAAGTAVLCAIRVHVANLVLVAHPPGDGSRGTHGWPQCPQSADQPSVSGTGQARRAVTMPESIPLAGLLPIPADV